MWIIHFYGRFLNKKGICMALKKQNRIKGTDFFATNKNKDIRMFEA